MQAKECYGSRIIKEISESVPQLLYLAPGQISLIAAPDLHLRTAARSHVRFSVGAEIFISSFLAGFEDAHISWYLHGIMQCLSFVCDCSFHKTGLI
jgi:hypothetical protein